MTAIALSRQVEVPADVVGELEEPARNEAMHVYGCGGGVGGEGESIGSGIFKSESGLRILDFGIQSGVELVASLFCSVMLLLRFVGSNLTFFRLSVAKNPMNCHDLNKMKIRKLSKQKKRHVMKTEGGRLRPVPACSSPMT